MLRSINIESVPLILNTDRGLYCPIGDFHIDAWRPVARNIVTHAHSDHARSGSERYLTAADGVRLLERRLGSAICVQGLEYGQSIDMGGVRVSLHPAGHVLGSSQVRIERGGEVCVVSGDYKLLADPTCRPFELVKCHTFVTECTFGLPIFRWREPGSVTQQINEWWKQNREIDRTSILLVYSLGKAQRVLAALDPAIGPILLHGAVHGMVEAYRQSGVALPPAEYATPGLAKQEKGKAIVLAPPSAMNSTWSRKLAPFSTGAASGWMQVRGFRRRRGADRGFVLSDHVDWPGLMQTIEQTGAPRVIATHGFTGPVVRTLRERGMDADAFETRFSGEADEDEDAANEATDGALPGSGPDDAHE
ncbi:MAG TPA: ligase-associated DNA damage response exonuclease [Tepidisphaeraceae bacterium]